VDPHHRRGSSVNVYHFFKGEVNDTMKYPRLRQVLKTILEGGLGWGWFFTSALHPPLAN
jgi:hypothetical protein